MPGAELVPDFEPVALSSTEMGIWALFMPLAWRDESLGISVDLDLQEPMQPSTLNVPSAQCDVNPASQPKRHSFPELGMTRIYGLGLALRTSHLDCHAPPSRIATEIPHVYPLHVIDRKSCYPIYTPPRGLVAD